MQKRRSGPNAVQGSCFVPGTGLQTIRTLAFKIGLHLFADEIILKPRFIGLLNNCAKCQREIHHGPIRDLDLNQLIFRRDNALCHFVIKLAGGILWLRPCELAFWRTDRRVYSHRRLFGDNIPRRIHSSLVQNSGLGRICADLFPKAGY